MHHVGKENDTFPAIEDATGVAGMLVDEVEQHREFEKGLERIETYLHAAIEEKEKHGTEGEAEA